LYLGPLNVSYLYTEQTKTSKLKRLSAVAGRSTGYYAGRSFSSSLLPVCLRPERRRTKFCYLFSTSLIWNCSFWEVDCEWI